MKTERQATELNRAIPGAASKHFAHEDSAPGAPRSRIRSVAVALGTLAMPPLALGAASSPKSQAQVPTRNDAGVPASVQTVPEATSLTWPDVTSDAPISDEWRGAEEVLPTRVVGMKAQRCKVRRVREWASIRCSDMATSAITQLGGMQKGVSFHLDAPGEDRLPREGVLVFPLRKDDRRVFTFWTLGDGYDGPLTVIPGVIVQADWQGEEPTLLLHEALHEPMRTAQSERRKRRR